MSTSMITAGTNTAHYGSIGSNASNQTLYINNGGNNVNIHGAFGIINDSLHFIIQIHLIHILFSKVRIKLYFIYFAI